MPPTCLLPAFNVASPPKPTSVFALLARTFPEYISAEHFWTNPYTGERAYRMLFHAEGAININVLKVFKDQERWRKEGKAMQRTSSIPLTAQALQIGELTPGSYYILMPFYSKGDLFEYVNAREGELDIKDILEKTTAIACTLACMHKLEIAHLDLKLENIFLGDKGAPVIGDFGFSTCLRGTFGDGYGGTLLTMSPEMHRAMISRQKCTTHVKPDMCAADVFSLGTVLFNMLMFSSTPRSDGSLPFHGFTSLRSAEKCFADNTRWVSIPEPVRAVVVSMLLEDPAGRPTASDVYKQLVSLR
jgi:serine/threonine protein kinase